mmetsp:Transcript_10731/g.21371  ORF Transcript_10731/g.21371 Transcript_10731/m.21371 type:complete len:278 (+) Transcript_10731:738-1571(+)
MLCALREAGQDGAVRRRRAAEEGEEGDRDRRQPRPPARGLHPRDHGQQGHPGRRRRVHPALRRPLPHVRREPRPQHGRGHGHERLPPRPAPPRQDQQAAPEDALRPGPGERLPHRQASEPHGLQQAARGRQDRGGAPRHQRREQEGHAEAFRGAHHRHHRHGREHRQHNARRGERLLQLPPRERRHHEHRGAMRSGGADGGEARGGGGGQHQGVLQASARQDRAAGGPQLLPEACGPPGRNEQADPRPGPARNWKDRRRHQDHEPLGEDEQLPRARH